MTLVPPGLARLLSDNYSHGFSRSILNMATQ